jgi:hypothetical protein
MDKFHDSLSNIVKLVSLFIGESGPFVEAEEEASYYEPFPVLGVKPEDMVFYPSPKRADFVAVDGSSKSLVSAGGIISVASVAVTGKTEPIKGVYPKLTGVKGLNLSAPFVALAPSTKSKSEILAASLESVMLRSITGVPFDATFGVSRVETELRANLETEALSAVDGRPLLDGPLLPSFSSLPNDVRRELSRRRYSKLPKDAVGVVKRIDRSKLLVESLRPYSREVREKFDLESTAFLSDEALVSFLVKKVAVPPYKPIAVGPIIYEPHGYRVHSYYLALPLHPYVRKFSIIRVETLSARSSVLDEVASLPLSSQGVPYPISYADKVAREVRGGLVKALKAYLESHRVGVSYAGNMAVMTG